MKDKDYYVRLDNGDTTIEWAKSLAEICNRIRFVAARIRTLSPIGLLLVDTKYGDIYNLVRG